MWTLKTPLNEFKAAIFALFIAVTLSNAATNESVESTADQHLSIRLPQAVVPVHYSITVAPDIYNATGSCCSFAGSVTIEVKIVNDTSIICLHTAQNVNITGGIRIRASANDAKRIDIINSSYSTEAEWQILHLSEKLQAGEKFVIDIEKFESQIKTEADGLFYVKYEDAGLTSIMAMAQFAPIGARKVFPCFDEPGMKATFNLSLIRRDDFAAVANTESLSNKSVRFSDWFGQESRDGSWVMEQFEETPVMSTHLLAFAVLKMPHIRRQDSGGRWHRIWARADVINATSTMLAESMRLTDFYENYFNVSAISTKLDYVAVPIFDIRCIGKFGLIAHREDAVLVDDYAVQDPMQLKYQLSIISHKIVHLWLGNVVTLSWWDDVWLSEGFATFLTILGFNSGHDDAFADEEFVTFVLNAELTADQGEFLLPLFPQATQTTADLHAIFNGIVFIKSPSVVRQLFLSVGPHEFRSALMKFVKEHQNSNANHQSFVQLLSQQINSILTFDISQMMDTWILQGGYPILTCSAAEKQLNIEQSPASNTFANTSWIIPVTLVTNRNVTSQKASEIHEAVQWMDSAKMQLPFSNFSGSDDWYLANLQSAGLYRVNYDSNNWRALADQLVKNHLVFTIQDRVRLIDDSYELFDGRDNNYSTFVAVLNYLRYEQDYEPWLTAVIKTRKLIEQLKSSNVLRTTNTGWQRKLTTICRSGRFCARKIPSKLETVRQKLVRQVKEYFSNFACKLSDMTAAQSEFDLDFLDNLISRQLVPYAGKFRPAVLHNFYELCNNLVLCNENKIVA